MQYKVRYRPLEQLTRDGWRRMSDQEQTRLITAATTPRSEKDGAIQGARGKDGQPIKFSAS